MTTGDILDRFREALVTLISDFDRGDEKLGLAVSGGPDSLALLLLAHETFPNRIAAATVDHELRPEAKAEADYVSQICSERSIAHQILKPSIPIRGNLQSEARKTRYNLLDGWMERDNIDWLATAHHADDQLETLVMRMLRGSGIDGMSAIRAKRGYIVRPLLRLSKNDLLEYLEKHRIKAVEDPSNHDRGFDRVRVRKALSHLEGFDVGLASQSAAALDDARQAISWIVDQLTDQHITRSENDCTLDEFDFPHEILRRLLLKCIHICEPALSPRGEQLEHMIAALKNGETVTIGNTLCKGGPKWNFSPAPERQS